MSFVKPAVIGKSLGTTSRLALLKSQENEFFIALSRFQVVVSGISPRLCKILANNVIRKVRQRRHWNPLFGHIGDEISKNREKKVHWASTGYEIQFSSKFGAKLSLPCPFFSWKLSTNHCCYVYKCPRASAINPESQYFIPLCNKIPWFCAQQPGGDEPSNEGCNSGPTGHDFTDNSIILKILSLMLDSWVDW